MRASSSDDNWYYAQNNERRGPVSFARLKAMAADGWLNRDDLVWRQGMANWVPARDAEGLFANPLGRVLQKTIVGLRRPAEKPVSEELRDATPPNIPLKTAKPAGRKARAKVPTIEWGELSPRHLIAACGGFLAALGIAFTAVAQSHVALAFTLSGLFIAAVGLCIEIGKLLGQAMENIGKASKEAAERRLRAKELALEKQRLDFVATRLAQEQAAHMATPVPAAVLANQQSELSPAGSAGTDQLVVVTHPPLQRWSPGLAAVLSFFVPGLGQLYKGQILNGIVWFFLVGMGYVALILPGLVLHFFCVLAALSGNPWTEGKLTISHRQ
jgi:TM2 domain-containing membrane protein YozV